MMDGRTIREMSQKAARQAARKHLCPLIVEKEDIPNLYEHLREMPNFGDYRPKKWELVETYFVDSSGFGSEGEPAWTIKRFLEHVSQQAEKGGGFGYALIEVGEFQVYIGEFTMRKGRKHGKDDTREAAQAV